MKTKVCAPLAIYITLVLIAIVNSLSRKSFDEAGRLLVVGLIVSVVMYQLCIRGYTSLAWAMYLIPLVYIAYEIRNFEKNRIREMLTYDMTLITGPSADGCEINENCASYANQVCCAKSVRDCYKGGPGSCFDYQYNKCMREGKKANDPKYLTVQD